MKGLQKKVLNAVAKIGLKTAIKACGAASYFATYQPKEPEMLKQVKKSKTVKSEGADSRQDGLNR